MGPELEGGASGTGRRIGEFVTLANGASGADLVGLEKLDRRVIPIAGNEQLAARMATVNRPASNFASVLAATNMTAAIRWQGKWYGYGSLTGSGTTFRVYVSPDGTPGSWQPATGFVPLGSTISGTPEFAATQTKLFLMVRHTLSTVCSLFQTTDGQNWSSTGKLNDGMLTIGGSTAVSGLRMKAFDGTLVIFGGCTRGGQANRDYLAWSTDDGVSFTLSACAVAAPVNNIALAGGEFISIHDGGGIQTAPTLLAAGGWTARNSGVTEALYCITATDAGEVHVVGALGRTLKSTDRRNWTKARTLDGVTTPARMVRVGTVDVLIASATALDNRRRISVSDDFENWRSELIDGATMPTSLLALATDGSRVAVVSNVGIAITEALAFNPATEIYLPFVDAGPFATAYVVARA
ncbi:hypothetical protein [Sphingomonas yantingensis]|uniref:Exo-alpha-sialidase n=1 Tax=Sphingomonas yantingensis TaxID=1241761 RepID=A0A7W9ASZ0_9SPHN|nr:hypothetical protein [Sphingomonas yantingensis]MBB5700023.1 hypothetical protein [Sphingomonas yantingensis]